MLSLKERSVSCNTWPGISGVSVEVGDTDRTISANVD